MINLMKYLKKSAGYIVLIIGLLFLQAYCDLSLPDYTSKVINVGIQQGGIPDGVPEKMRQSTMENLQIFMDEDTQKEVQDSYVLDGDTYELKDGITGDKREELNNLLCKPLMMYTSFTSGSEESQKMLSQMQVPEGTDPMQVLSAMPEDAKKQMLEAADEKLSDMPESILTQAAVSGVKAEYEAMGEDLDAIQMNYIRTSGIQMVLMALVIMLAAVSVTFLSARVAAALGHDLRDNVYRKVIHFSSNEYHKFSTASLITRSTNDVQQVQQVMTMMFRIVLYAPILGIGGVLKVLQTDSSMTWILGAAVAIILIVIFVLFQIAMPKFTRLQTLIDRLNLVTREILTGIPVIRAFSREKHEEERFEKANMDLTKTNLFVNRCMTFMMPIMMLIMNGVSVAIIYFGAHGVDNGTMQVGNMMAFIQYAMQIIMSFLMITAISIMLPRANVAAGRICEVLEMEPSVNDPEEPVVPDRQEKGTVEFDHVSFAYPEAGENVINDITFKAEKGQTVAIIGSTGSGKSTLINLIPRFYDVSSGAIYLDGKDIRKIKLKDLRNQIGIVQQDVYLFAGNIMENIRYGRPDATDEEVIRAAKLANAHDFIMEMPDNYGTDIGQRGVKLSGGQKQRLSIARAFLKNPPILIFDEATSALDNESEKVVQQSLERLAKDRTTFVIAHRLSTIRNARRILVLTEDGIAEEGTHQELMEKDGVYAKLCKAGL